MCMIMLLVCLHVGHMYTVVSESRIEHEDPWNLNKMAEKHHVGTSKQIYVLS